MTGSDPARLRRRIRVWLVVFILGLVASGVTAFPLEWETGLLAHYLAAPGSWPARTLPGLAVWIQQVHTGLRETYAKYPFIAYGTDWLAFAHLAIAVAFVGPLREPTRHRWVVEWGMICCVAVVPLALICGPLRGIPLGWRLLDCSFGVLGIVPLWLVRRDMLRLEALTARDG